MRDVRLLMAIVLTGALLPMTGCGGGGEAQQGSGGQGGGAGSAPRSADARPGAQSDPQGSPGGTPGGTPAGAPGDLVSGHAPVPGLSGAESLPSGHPPVARAGAIVPPPDGSGEGASAISWAAPAGWKEEPPTSRMRRTQFRIPRAAGDLDDGECAVFYFGPGQGGTPESNASRWVNQFQQSDGSSSEGKAKIAMRGVGGDEVMFVEVKGTFVGMAMPGMGGGAPKEGYALLGAIVPGPDAPWFFKFTGPAKTVEANRAAFERLIASIRKGAAA